MDLMQELGLTNCSRLEMHLCVFMCAFIVDLISRYHFVWDVCRLIETPAARSWVHIAPDGNRTVQIQGSPSQGTAMAASQLCKASDPETGAVVTTHSDLMMAIDYPTGAQNCQMVI